MFDVCYLYRDTKVLARESITKRLSAGPELRQLGSEHRRHCVHQWFYVGINEQIWPPNYGYVIKYAM